MSLFPPLPGSPTHLWWRHHRTPKRGRGKEGHSGSLRCQVNGNWARRLPRVQNKTATSSVARIFQADRKQGTSIRFDPCAFYFSLFLFITFFKNFLFCFVSPPFPFYIFFVFFIFSLFIFKHNFWGCFSVPSFLLKAILMFNLCRV